MAKATITRKYSISAEGILYMSDDSIYIENPETGLAVDLKKLLEDFADKTVKLSVNYGEDYTEE